MFFQELASPFDSVTQMNILRNRLNRLATAQTETRSEFPPVNIWASEEKIVIMAEVPGVNADDLDLQVCNKTVTLKTKRELVVPEEGQTFHKRERGHGEFTRSIELPYAIDSENVEASFRNGVLRIEFTRATADLPKKITIHAS